MSNEEDLFEAEKILIQNLKAIVNNLPGDDAEAGKTKVDEAVTKLESTLANIKKRRKTGDSKKLWNIVAERTLAHSTFASDVKYIKVYLEQRGFTKLQEKRYTESEINALVLKKA